MIEKRADSRTNFTTDDNSRIIILEGRDASANMLPVHIVDISEHGVGLMADIALRPGQELEFVEEDKPHTAKKMGVVMWAMVIGEHFRVGVKFI